MKYLILNILAISFLFIGCNNKQGERINQNNLLMIAQKIKITDFEDVLNHLKNHQTEFDFIGITSNGIDCIYIVNKDSGFNIEFEAITEDQVPYISKLKDFAIVNNLKYIMTTYGNDADYTTDTAASVFRIETPLSLNQILEYVEKIQFEIFENNYETVYDVVP